MTVFGKILTFVILVLALSQAALHVMFHIAQSKYVAENERMNTSLNAAKAQIDAYRKELDDQKTQAAAAVAEQQTKVTEVKGLLANANKTIDEQKNNYALLEKTANQTLNQQLT